MIDIDRVEAARDLLQIKRTTKNLWTEEYILRLTVQLSCQNICTYFLFVFFCF